MLQNNKELAVAEQETGRLIRQALLRVLNKAGRQTAVLTEVEPGPFQKAAAVFTGKKEPDLINEYPCPLALLPVGGHAIDDGIEHDKHSDGPELLPQLQYIKAENAAGQVHVCLVGKDVQASLCEQLQRKGNTLRLLLRLLKQHGMKVTQRRRITGIVAQVVLIDQCHTSVKDGLLLRAEPAAPHQLVAEGQHKFGLEHHGIVLTGIVGIDRHSVDMIWAVGGYLQNRTAEGADERRILSVRIDDQNIVLR